MWPPVKVVVMEDAYNNAGCKKNVNNRSRAEGVTYYRGVSPHRQWNCSLREKSLVAQDENYSGLINLNYDYEVDMMNDHFTRDLQLPGNLRIPVIKIGYLDAYSIGLMANRETADEFGEIVLSYGYHFNRSARVNTTFFMDVTDRESFEMLPKIKDFIDEHKDLKISFNIVFAMIGCNSCSEEDIQKYCMVSKGREYCVFHEYHNMNKAAEATLIHSLLMSLKEHEFDYKAYAKQYVERCIFKLERADNFDLDLCAKSILSQDILAKVETLSQNSELYSHPSLISYIQFAEKKKPKRPATFWINGRHLRGSMEYDNLIQAVCNAFKPTPEKCKPHARKYMSLLELNNRIKINGPEPIMTNVGQSILLFIASIPPFIAFLLVFICLLKACNKKKARQDFELGPTNDGGEDPANSNQITTIESGRITEGDQDQSIAELTENT